MQLNNFGNLTYLVKMCVFSLFFFPTGAWAFSSFRVEVFYEITEIQGPAAQTVKDRNS